MEFVVLGPVEARRDGAAVAIGSRRQRALLARLLVDVGKVVTVDALAEALWGHAPPADPRNAIQTYVARLRGLLGPGAWIVTRDPGYVLDTDPETLDAVRFERYLVEAQRRRDDPAAARDLLDEALGLWRGPAYGEFADEFAHSESLRLAERRLVALEERVAARLALGEAGDLAGELEAAVTDHPLRERFTELLMRALAEVDRQADALAAYRTYRDRLAEDTGLEPSAALRDLESRILRGELARRDTSHDTAYDASRGTGPGAAAPSAERPPPEPPGHGAVPRFATSFVGRGEEVTAVRGTLANHRLVTLIGTGGIGKTRLAVEVVGGLDEPRPPEIGWVDLAAVTDGSALDHVVADTLGVDLTQGSTPRAVLLEALAARRLLLVLDNCEHLVEAAASLSDGVLRQCPHVRVLATSRERLAVDGEQVVPVAPLPVDADNGAAAAVDLFLARAAAAGADLRAARGIVAEVCRELDGLPLGIELAAARASAVPLEELRSALRDEADILGQRRSSTPRHRDLHTVVDWSYRMLDEAEQRLFERLGVFAGWFDAELAHEVCAVAGQSRTETLAGLTHLAECSLLNGPAPADDGTHRYRVLRPIRRFARARLADRGEGDELARRYAEALVATAERAAGPPLTGDGWRRIDASLDDLREAARHAEQAGRTDLLARLVNALYRFAYWRTWAELGTWAERALALPGIDEVPAAPAVYAAAAASAWARGDLEAAHRLAVHGVELDDAEAGARALAFEALADAAFFEGRLGDAAAAFSEQARLGAACADPDSLALGQVSAALVRAYGGDVDAAIAQVDEAAAAARAAGPAVQAFAHYARGECRVEHAPADARTFAGEAAELASVCGARFVEGVARLTAASVRGREDDPREALPAFAELLEHWRRSGNWTQQWTTLRNLVELLVRAGDDEPAITIAAAAAADDRAAPTFGAESDRLAEALVTAHARLGAERAAAARVRGQRMHPQEVIDYALAAAATA